ncbi:hypothetical protein BC939DRAFT_202301 [Gamsiella multidivaricata]|uniref:uncharacterized protein n=1 Tax=Gamsiella multidivaricata TaxID=101098 RepID=UPI00221F88C9|nr:uncharacterized protein BC939DRAFT_202301 [Gamsiella multidivaricata]KAI7821723.1 hypothetical protein BC939DRAFT_202301 [Gamsiella multidivaricata]
MLSTSLASPSTSQGKIPLNVVFIIDTYLPAGFDKVQAARAAALLKRTLTRTLLYFQCSMDPKFQWTYMFFNSRAHQNIGLIPNRILHSLTMSTVANCVDEYRRIVTPLAVSTSPKGKGATTVAGITSKVGGSGTVSPCYNLRRQFVHSLADFGLDIASYQSPMKSSSSFIRSQSLQKHFPPVAIRNYMYVLSPLPRTWGETAYFLDGKQHTQNDMGPRRSDILEVLKGIKDAFFEQGLWDRFLDQHTSLSWIDTSMESNTEEQAKSTTRISATMLIRSTLELIIKAFGGYIIPQSVICQPFLPKDVYSFATIFQTYRSLQIHPGLGVKMSKDSWQALPSASIGLHSEDMRPVRVMWSGDLVCLESLQFICSLDVSEPFPRSASNEDPISNVDPIESLEVIKRFPSRSLSANLHRIRIARTMTCFPQIDKDEPCEHALYLLRSLRSKSDVLLLQITFACMPACEDQKDSDKDLGPQTYTCQALLHPTAPGSGILQILEEGSDLSNLGSVTAVSNNKSRPFTMAMMEKSWGRLGAFADLASKRREKPLYRLDDMPHCLMSRPRLQQVAPDTFSDSVVDPRSSVSRPLPGQSVAEMEASSFEIEAPKSIDGLCLKIRNAYIKHLYHNEFTVTDYVKRLNAASKEITALAAKQSVPLKEAQQSLVAFMIEFLRIWPTRMGSKHKQIAKELNTGKINESKSQDHYVILNDERPELDAWKASVMKSVNDADIRAHLKKLKTKDIQIQVVQNLHVLLLIDKYGLEENKPFKKDPGALKTVNLFMDELCIEASIDDRPSGLKSPQTPRSRDMDAAKKFFTRVVTKYYELSLPKIVDKLSIKCGVEKTLLSSPRPSRGAKREGIKRSISMGILQRPSPLDFTMAMKDGGDELTLSRASISVEGTALKHGFPATRQLTSEKPTRNVLNNSIFRNRQVVMTLGSVKGVRPAPSTNPTSTTTKEQAAPAQSQTGLQCSTSMNTTDELEEEDGPPKLAKLRLKKFYHDKESEEVLKATETPFES